MHAQPDLGIILVVEELDRAATVGGHVLKEFDAVARCVMRFDDSYPHAKFSNLLTEVKNIQLRKTDFCSSADDQHTIAFRLLACSGYLLQHRRCLIQHDFVVVRPLNQNVVGIYQNLVL